MVKSQFSIAWNTYNANICSGFSSLQQNGEFVDMTLAADGHFVKVHQAMIALASPYLKNLITSAPCQHPIIFLNNVSHTVLCLLLEYIYTGEVMVPAESLSMFVEIGKTLHIKGLENMNSSYSASDSNISPNATKIATEKTPGLIINKVSSELKPTPITTVKNSEQLPLPLPLTARKVIVKHNESRKFTFPDMPNLLATPKVDPIDYSHTMDDPIDHDTDDGAPEIKPNAEFDAKSTTSLQFTVSIRGSLQVILNRYLYNLHSMAQRSGVRRWRCVNYRNSRCAAFVVTKGNVVVSRGNLHNHAYHDKKILSKIEKNAVYSVIDDVEGYKEKEATIEEDSSLEQDDFITEEKFVDTGYTTSSKRLKKNTD